MIAPALGRHVSGLAETRLARTALRLACSAVCRAKPRLLLWAGLRGTGDQGFEALQLHHARWLSIGLLIQRIGFDSQIMKSIRKPAASPPCPRLRPKVRQR
jgi:hypothetical protein